jgi:hypothetical protein
LFTIQNIVYLPHVDLSRTTPIPSAAFAKDWPTKTWKTITPFVWEPIGVLYPVNHLMIFIAIPNLLLGVLLGTLIGMNLALGVYGLLAARRGISSLRGLLGALPSLLTGFACCVPTFVIALGSVAASLTVGIIAVRPIFIPVSVLALSLNLLWSARRLVGTPGEATPQ